MEINHLLKAGFGRRGFLSGSSLLLTGALLGAAEESKAGTAPLPAAPEPVPQEEKECAICRPGDCQPHSAGSGSGGWVRTHQCSQSRQPESLFHFALARSRLVTVSDIVELDFDCVPANGDTRKLYSERWIHAEIYRARPDVKSMVHTHAPTVVVMGTINEPLLPFTTWADSSAQACPRLTYANLLA